MITPWLLPVVVPLAVALMLLFPGASRRLGLWLVPWAALPALLFALLPDPGSFVTVPWLLLGTTLGLDMVGQVFLFLAAFLWLISGVYARTYLSGDPHATRFFVFFLLAMAGNIGLTVAQDVASFYLFFALMTLSAYPLIIHSGHPSAMRAGRVYLVMTLIGETLLLLALWLIVSSSGTLALGAAAAAVAASPARDVIVLFLLVGFGIKVGLVPFHIWLPLVYPAAPTPASAVLSGTMIAAGVLGWLRFLPLGEVGLSGWGGLLVAIGLISAFYGVIVGVTQGRPKTSLAYSSISQMGIFAIAVGVGLLDPAAWPAAQMAVLVLVLHHGLAKASLFLGEGLVARTTRLGRRRRLLVAAMTLPALALAGAPFTSGAIAKLSLKDAATMATAPWAAWLEILLPLVAIGTTILMVRFLLILFAMDEGRVPSPGRVDHESSLPAGLVTPWALLTLAVAWAALSLATRVGERIQVSPLDPRDLWLATWPVIVGLCLFLVVWGVLRRPSLQRARLECARAGATDRLVALPRSTWRRSCGGIPRLLAVGRSALRGPRWSVRATPAALDDRLAAIEAGLTTWPVAGALFVAIVLGLVMALVWP